MILQLPELPLTYSDLTVSGDDEGIFGVESGFLYALKPLDRERQPSYSLQVKNHMDSFLFALTYSHLHIYNDSSVLFRNKEIYVPEGQSSTAFLKWKENVCYLKKEQFIKPKVYIFLL